MQLRPALTENLITPFASFQIPADLFQNPVIITKLAYRFSMAAEVVKEDIAYIFISEVAEGWPFELCQHFTFSLVRDKHEHMIFIVGQ